MTGQTTAHSSAIDFARPMLSEPAEGLNHVGKKTETVNEIRMVGNPTQVNV